MCNANRRKAHPSICFAAHLDKVLIGREVKMCACACVYTRFQAIRINDIRSDTDAPGLRDFEASFLRLVDKLTNGSALEINDTGTKLRFRPGIITGGSGLEHDCGKSRGIGWFVEGLLCLLPFAKNPVSITLKVGLDRVFWFDVESVRRGKQTIMYTWKKLWWIHVRMSDFKHVDAWVHVQACQQVWHHCTYLHTRP